MKINQPKPFPEYFSQAIDGLYNLPPDSVIEGIATKFNISFEDAMLVWNYPDIKISKVVTEEESVFPF